MSNLIPCFSEVPKTFTCARVRQVTFLSEDWKRSVLFTVSTLEMREREAYGKQTGSNVSALLNKVSALEHNRFMQVCRFHCRLPHDYLQKLKPKS